MTDKTVTADEQLMPYGAAENASLTSKILIEAEGKFCGEKRVTRLNAKKR